MKTIVAFALGLLFFTGTATHSATHENQWLAASVAKPALATAQDSDTETVLSTMRCKPGKEDELQKTLAQEWTMLRKLGLALADPHVLLKGKDDGGKPIFVEVLTWRDHETPDHVPPEVQAIWNHLQQLVEARDGHKGIEFPEFEIVN